MHRHPGVSRVLATALCALGLSACGGGGAATTSAAPVAVTGPTASPAAASNPVQAPPPAPTPSASPTPAPAPTPEAAPSASANINLGSTPMLGVNLSGCEFAADGALCPTPATVDAYFDKGFRAFRIPFRGAQADNEAVVARIKAAADAATARGAYVILDRHDYGATFDPDLASWWAKFITAFPDADRVMIDTMNEPKTGAPYEVDPATGKSYATEVNAGISAFRKAGFRHKLLIEWRGSSGMSRFDKKEPATKACESPACSFDRAGGLKDPLGLTMISGHRYPDADGSGTSATCVSNSSGAQLVSNADEAAAARGLKLWVGEFAFGNHAGVSATCAALGGEFIARMRAMPRTYAGVSWWGGGAHWKDDYLYKIEPAKGTFASAAPSVYLLAITGR